MNCSRSIASKQRLPLSVSLCLSVSLRLCLFSLSLLHLHFHFHLHLPLFYSTLLYSFSSRAACQNRSRGAATTVSTTAQRHQLMRSSLPFSAYGIDVIVSLSSLSLPSSLVASLISTFDFSFDFSFVFFIYFSLDSSSSSSSTFPFLLLIILLIIIILSSYFPSVSSPFFAQTF